MVGDSRREEFDDLSSTEGRGQMRARRRRQRKVDRGAAQYLGAVAPGLIVAATLAVTLGACGREQHEEVSQARTVVPGPEITVVGQPVAIQARPAPPIDAPTSSGHKFLLETHRNKVVLVNFWATWCAPCIEETPLLVDTYSTLRDSGLVVLGVSMDTDGFDIVRPYLDRFDVNYPVILGNSELAAAFGGAYVLPTTFFVDRRGNIVSRINGRLHADILGKELSRLL